MTSDPSAAPEGRRARKRRETHTRIADTAMMLFLERGFGSVTMDEIAAAADVSKRSLFDYFPAKEDLITAWQDKFAVELTAEVASRPAAEPLPQVIERSMTEAIARTATAESFAITALIRATPTLNARDQLKYLTLETSLARVLLQRGGFDDPLGAKLLGCSAD